MQTAHNLADISAQFHEAMSNAGIVIDAIPVADSQLHRFKIDGDKNGSKNGWYVIFPDGTIPAGGTDKLTSESP